MGNSSFALQSNIFSAVLNTVAVVKEQRISSVRWHYVLLEMALRAAGGAAVELGC